MSAIALAVQGHRLIQIGVALFLFTSFQGFAIPYFAAPNLGRSVHTLSGFTGVLLVAVGLIWPRLKLTSMPSRLAFWFLIFSALATIAGFVIAAVLGAGGSIMPIAAAGHRGSDAQELLIQLVMYPAAPTGIISFSLILWGASRQRGSCERRRALTTGVGGQPTDAARWPAGNEVASSRATRWDDESLLIVRNRVNPEQSKISALVLPKPRYKH